MATKKPIPAAFDTQRSLEERWTSLQDITRMARFKHDKLIQLLEQYQAIGKALQRDAVNEFKARKKAEFMSKFESQIMSKKFTNEFLLEYAKLEEMDNHGCYILKGVNVGKQDCNFCSKHCKVKEFMQ